ncbi:hypothetical protein GCM10025864_28420 [Luteimicrobium album]|uniref:dTDP-4-dehydrorhamnose 3,5-epimerase n=1 Tax=Luteimicrobium album TaxID=1054550 RepID=A0ABQ6I4L9_9MICO|nr:hypothetical protein GCM10025864_28420 [Luteimicrobium album]
MSAAGVVRGIHFADVPPSQAKYVTCAKGAVLDVVVDIRVGSPTFGRWDSVLLDDVDRRAIYLSEGLGHAFMSLEDDSTVLYLCSAPYAPGREHGIHPLDPEVGVAWPTTARDGSPLTPLLSDKDEAAPTLVEAREQGLLPRLEDVEAFVVTLPDLEPQPTITCALVADVPTLSDATTTLNTRLPLVERVTVNVDLPTAPTAAFGVLVERVRQPCAVSSCRRIDPEG